MTKQDKKDLTRLAFDRDKPMNLEFGLWTSSKKWGWIFLELMTDCTQLTTPVVDGP